MRRLALVPILALLAACGEDEAAGPEPADIGGTWTYSASDVSGSDVVCTISGVTATVVQSGSTFTGSVAGGTANCSGFGQTLDEDLGPGTITNGVISGNEVSFDIDNLDAQHTGTVSGNTMSGTLDLTLELPPPLTGTIDLSGNWTATRQP